MSLRFALRMFLYRGRCVNCFRESLGAASYSWATFKGFFIQMMGRALGSMRLAVIEMVSTPVGLSVFDEDDSLTAGYVAHAYNLFSAETVEPA